MRIGLLAEARPPQQSLQYMQVQNYRKDLIKVIENIFSIAT